MLGRITWLVAALVVLGCKDNEGPKPRQEDSPSPPEKRMTPDDLVERLNQSYGDEGKARLEGDTLIVATAQCRDPKLAKAVVDFASRAARRAGITDVRCEAPPGPSKGEIVKRFNQEFASIGARAAIGGRGGRALELTTDECAGAEQARKLLDQAADLSREAGFEMVRCGQAGERMFELDLRATED